MPATDGKIVENMKKQQNAKKRKLLNILIIILIIAVIVSIFAGVFYLIVSNNVGGVTERHYSSLKKIPVLNLALPEAPDPLNPLYMTADEIKKKYNEFRSENQNLKEQLADANKQMEEYKEFKGNYDALMKQAEEKLKELDERETAIKKEELRLKELKSEIDKLIANGNPESYKKYYEAIDPENAEMLYRSIVKEDQLNANMKKLAKIYEEMDAAAAAKIFERLGESKIDMIAETFRAMDQKSASEIMGSMNPDFAAKLTEKLNELYRGN